MPAQVRDVRSPFVKIQGQMCADKLMCAFMLMVSLQSGKQRKVLPKQHGLRGMQNIAASSFQMHAKVEASILGRPVSHA